MKKALIAGLAVFAAFLIILPLEASAPKENLKILSVQPSTKAGKSVITVKGETTLPDDTRIYFLLRNHDEGDKVIAIGAASAVKTRFEKTWPLGTLLYPGNYSVFASTRSQDKKKQHISEYIFKIGTDNEIAARKEEMKKDLAKEIETLSDLFEQLNKMYRDCQTQLKENGYFDTDEWMQWSKFWIPRAKKTAHSISQYYGSDQTKSAELRRRLLALSDSVFAYHYYCSEKLGLKGMFNIDDVAIPYVVLKDNKDQTWQDTIKERFAKVREMLAGQ